MASCNCVVTLLGISTQQVKELYSGCCLIGHIFKGIEWCNVNNTNVTSRRKIRNLSLAYPNICVWSWYEEPFQTFEEECFAKIVNGFCKSTLLTKRFILDSDRVLNMSLILYKYCNCKDFVIYVGIILFPKIAIDAVLMRRRLFRCTSQCLCLPEICYRLSLIGKKHYRESQ